MEKEGYIKVENGLSILQLRHKLNALSRELVEIVALVDRVLAEDKQKDKDEDAKK